MNHVYNTRGFVLAHFPHGEYNKRLVILTREFGVIRVTAQAVRKIESKLRTSIQDFAEAEFFLVHGKSGWRLTNTSHVRNLHSALSPRDFQMMARIFSLVTRLIPEEDNASRVFSVIESVLTYVDRRAIDDVHIEPLEILSNLKILSDLGYIPHDAELAPLIAGNVTDEALAEITRHKKEAIKLVNQAIRESHL